MSGPQPQTLARRTAVLVAPLLAASALAPVAAAHNPANTVLPPAEVGDHWLAVGGEGTYGYLASDGSVAAEGNLSGDVEVFQAPVTTGPHAAVMARTIPNLVPQVRGFDAEGPTWTVEIDEGQGVGSVVPRGDVFEVFVEDGKRLSVTAEGEVTDEGRIPVEPQALPVPAPDGDWWVAGAEEIVRLSEGQVVERAPYSGQPTDLTATDDHLLVSLRAEDEQRVTLMAFDRSLELDWSRSMDGLRIGGHPAVLDDLVVVGTFNPDAARLFALDPADGSLAWERGLGNLSATAPAAFGNRIAAATVDGIHAFSADGTPLWNHSMTPGVASPGTLDGLIVPQGANNVLVALEPDGTVAWTWSDGSRSTDWPTDHAAAGVEETASGDGPLRGAPLGAGLAALAGLAAALALGRRPRS